MRENVFFKNLNEKEVFMLRWLSPFLWVTSTNAFGYVCEQKGSWPLPVEYGISSHTHIYSQDLPEVIELKRQFDQAIRSVVGNWELTGIVDKEEQQDIFEHVLNYDGSVSVSEIANYARNLTAPKTVKFFVMSHLASGYRKSNFVKTTGGIRLEVKTIDLALRLIPRGEWMHEISAVETYDDSLCGSVGNDRRECLHAPGQQCTSACE